MIRLIAAIDNKRGIAKSGVIPWDISDDRHFFREQTSSKGGVVLMGKKTYDAIGHPLRGRRNIVLSKQQDRLQGVEIINNLSILNTLSNIWVIGGAEVFDQIINQADELYLTHIESDFGCDQFFPDYKEDYKQKWQSETKEQNGLKFWYEILERKLQ